MDKPSIDPQNEPATKEVVEEVVVKPKLSNYVRSWRLLDNDKRRVLITVLFLAVFLPVAALAVKSERLKRGKTEGPIAPPISSPTPSPNPELDCTESGGKWRMFSDACADNCDQTISCEKENVYSCDCGNQACWDGSVCVPDPTASPQPSSAHGIDPSLVPSSTNRPTIINPGNDKN